MAHIEKGKMYRCTKGCWLPVINEQRMTIGRKYFAEGKVFESVDDGILRDTIGNKCCCDGALEIFFDEIKQCDDDEKVEHPNHYNQNCIECFDVIKAAIGEVGFNSFCYGNVLKYLFRANYKGSYMEDLKKAMFYLKEIIGNE